MQVHSENPIAVPQEPEDEFAFWPLNLILVMLGATILGLVFTYLDPFDPRWIYNPWTYAVLTPVALFLISVVLSTLVSRVVEKSMQLAFLLSVLVHILFLIGAMNVVIFSRLWPDIVESLAMQRHQLKRQMLQANQYHRITSTSQTGARPDYLTYVPTQHQPTEVEQQQTLDLSLAHSATVNLVSPSPEIERQANPHLLRRQQAAASVPATLNSMADLSRSRVQQELNAESLPEVYEMPFDSRQPPELKPLTEDQRKSTHDSLETPMPNSDTALVRKSTSLPPMRERANDSAQPADRERSPTALPRSSTEKLRSSQATIPLPAAADTLPADESRLANQPAASHFPRRQTEANRMPGPRTMRPPEISAKSAVQRREDLARNQTEPLSGDIQEAMPRSTAGGRAGLSAPSSMPVMGLESLGAEVPNQLALSPAPLVAPSRSSGRRRKQSSLSQGLSRAPQFNAQPGLSGGTSGLSRATRATDGKALADDVAGLSGAGQVIERSHADAISIPGSKPIDYSDNQQGLGTGNTQQLDADTADVARTNSGNQGSLSTALEPQSPHNADGFDLGRATSSEIVRNVGDRELSFDAPATQEALQRQPSEQTPQTGEIGLPESPAMREAGQGDAAAALAQNTASRRVRNSNINLMDIDSPDGLGGALPSPEAAGDLLPRRRELTQRLGPSELEVQRFARQDVGGPLAAGQIAMPQPAFRQRIERLRDRDPLEQTSAEPQTELAIERGLAFLARNQRPDGAWRLQDFDTPVLMTSDTAATGLALLAFQGAGYTHKEFKYADHCQRALRFLIEHQAESGDLYIPQNPASDQNAWLYSHAMAAIALCEAYGMTQDQDLKPAAQRAIDFIVDSQDARRGGWRYRPGAGSDTSVSGWFMMALKSGELAGLDVPPITFERLQFYLESSQARDGQAHLYRYNPYAADTPQQRHGLKPTAVMTSVGLLMRLYTGWQRDRKEMMAGAEYLLLHLPENGTQEISKRDTYYWYYATQVMFHMGGDTWRAWHDTLYPMLIQSQKTQGEDKGSWDPMTPTPDLWARYGGRLYVTTMNLLSLEVSYRHLPLYVATAPSED